MNFNELISQKNYSIYNKDIAREFGINFAVILGQMCTLADSFENDFSYEQTRIAEENGISRKTVYETIKEIEKEGFITCDFKGNPPVRSCRLNLERFNKFFGIDSDISSTSNIAGDIQPISIPEKLTRSRVSKSDDEPTSKDRKILESEEYELVTRILSESNCPFKKHRLSSRPTVLIKKVVGYIKMIEEGTFLDSIDLDEAFSSRNVNGLRLFHAPTFLTDFEKVFKKSIEGFKERRKPIYYPSNKNSLENMSLDTFFYNPRTRFSWFLECAINEPVVISTIRADEAFDKIPRSFIEEFDKYFNYYTMSDGDKIRYADTVTRFYKWHEELKTLYEGINFSSHWMNYYKGTRSFAEQIMYYFNHYHSTQGLYYLSTKDFKTRFINWAYDYHHVDLNPSDSYLEKLRKENEENMQKIKRKEEGEYVPSKRDLEELGWI